MFTVMQPVIEDIAGSDCDCYSDLGCAFDPWYSRCVNVFWSELAGAAHERECRVQFLQQILEKQHDVWIG